MCPPVRGQPVEEGVTRRVVGLTRRADQARHRREHHERRHIQLAGELVQIPGRIHFGPQHRVDSLGRQRGDHRVVEHTGRVDHRRQRELRRDRGDHRGQRVTVGGVAGDDGRPGPGRLQFLDERGGLGVRATATQQHQVPRAVSRHQMAGQRRTRHAGSAGDQDRARRPRARQGHDDLADVASLAEIAQRTGSASHIEGRHRQGPQHTGVEKLCELEHPLMHPGAARLEQVEGPVPHAGIFPRDRVGVADVGLAHLQEHATGGDQAQRGVHELAGQRIQHHVHPGRTGPGGHRPELLLELEAARIPDVVIVKAHGPQRVPLATAGRGEHLQAQVTGQLHGGHPHPAGRGVHQHPLAGPNLGQMDERHVCRGEHRGDGGCLGVGPVRRFRQQQAHVAGHQRAAAVREESVNRVADREFGDVRADLDDDTRALAAEQRVVGEHAQRDHHVTEVGGDGAQRHPNVSRLQRCVGARNRFQA
ncbi:hypothetical protein MYSI104531_27135 [Mycobacterium simiae]